MKVGFCINRKCPVFGFSADGIMDGKFLLEVKCPKAGKKYCKRALCKRLPYLQEQSDGLFVLKETHCHYTQVQLGLAVLNLHAAKFLVYFKNTTTKNRKKSTVEGVIKFHIERVVR